ncbi:hypothetical protein NC651_011254 [Populus alba x Populus x berolinensis]|nr:hypothetical protein NC651_011254 [Populus alba x Populus x berolinensis]
MPVHVWGHRTSSRDIMVKLIRSVRGVRRVIKTLKSKSLDRTVKNKGESVLDSVNGAPAFQTLVGCAIQRPIFLIKPCSLQLSQSKSCDELQALQSRQFTTFHARILMESVIRARTRHLDWTQERIKYQVFSSSYFLVSQSLIYLLKQQCKIKEWKGNGDGDAIISFVFVLFFLLHNLLACISVGNMCWSMHFCFWMRCAPLEKKALLYI